MGSPTLFANPFSVCSNYLLNAKPGEKRSLFDTNILNRSQRRPSSVPLVIDVFADFQEKHLEANMGNTYITKFSGKIPFQAPVPPVKMPSLVGGYVGAKSQSLREESAKLCDILASSISSIFGNDMLNLQDNKLFNMHNFGQEKMYKATADPELYKWSPPKVAVNKTECTVLPLKLPADTIQTLTEMKKTGISEDQDSSMTKTTTKNQCDISQGDDRDKPPMKKPKLNLKPCRSSRRKHKGRRKKCVKNVQCESPAVAPGYDPTQSTFECIDEVDCGIKLSNRFAPLEDITAFHVDMETSDLPILDMLSEMHLDDFEVNLDSVSPSVEIFNVHSYERTDSPLTCNSSIAFILGGNDDILTSDSEDGGSLSSDLDDFQWQSFKTDFEFFQDQIPFQNLIAESCGLNNVHFENNLEVVDDDVFLNDLEYYPTCDAEQRLRDVNLRWNQLVECEDGRQSIAKVRFAPDECLTSIQYIPSGPEECQARKGPWDQCYLDRCRFERRIQEVEPVISLCLTPQHRKTVFQRLFGSEN